MESQELAVLSAPRDINVMLKEGAHIAGALAKYAESAQLYKKIGDSKHLMVEGWGMVAAAFQVTARTVQTEYLDFGGGVWGFKATAEAVSMATGQVVGRGEALCTNDEERWSARPQYEWIDGNKTKVGMVNVPRQQLMSMAQTRATSKALSSVFRWVAKLGGFSGTAAEEMDDSGSGRQQRNAPQQPRKAENSGNGGGAVISEAQMKRMYAIAKNKGLNDDQYREFLKRHGFEHSKDVTRAKYEPMIADLEAAGKSAEPEAEAIVSEKQRDSLVNAAEAVGWSPTELEKLLSEYKVGRIDHLPASQYAGFLAALKTGPK
jgi:hypothetical protein